MFAGPTYYKQTRAPSHWKILAAAVFKPHKPNENSQVSGGQELCETSKLADGAQFPRVKINVIMLTLKMFTPAEYFALD